MILLVLWCALIITLIVVLSAWCVRHVYRMVRWYWEEWQDKEN